MTEKESVRSAWLHRTKENPILVPWGKAAQKLRSLQVYREAETVFATPDTSLLQARINCLVDGKNLLMPAPAIREGFYLLPGRSIPFPEIARAVTYRGLTQKGLLQHSSKIAELTLGLLLTGSLTIDNEGGRIGDGNGFFDLSCALLHELGALQQEWTALSFISEDHVSRVPLPQDVWDIKLAGVITDTRVHSFSQPEQTPKILWDKLPRDRIKKIDPLWKLYSRKL